MPNVKGATRKPTGVMNLTGAIERNPKRHAGRKSEPKPTKPLGDPPKHFSDGEAEIWYEVAAQCAPGVLFGSDRFALEQIAVLIFKSRYTSITSMERALLMSGLQQFGFTPVSRSRVAAAPDKKKDDSWQGLLSPATSTYKQ